MVGFLGLLARPDGVVVNQPADVLELCRNI